MRVAVLVTRLPAGEMHGRKVVLRTAVESLRALGHEVDLVLVEGRAAPTHADFDGCRLLHLPVPAPGRVFGSVVTKFLGQGWSLNEALYWDPAILDRIRTQLAEWGTELVVSDMIRLSEYAARSGVPDIQHIDDLLSVRYAAIADEPDHAELLLGYYANNLPRVLRPFADWCARRLLRVEARRLESRERLRVEQARHAAVVSTQEADVLRATTGRDVSALPMAVPAVPYRADAGHRPASVVFLGGLKLQGNLAALRWYRDHVVGLLPAGSSVSMCTVIGASPEHLQRDFPREHFTFVGYVPDLFQELARHQILVAPIRGGTGIKTKVLEGMAVGLCVLSSPDGIAGLDVANGVECFIARDPREWERVLSAVDADPRTGQAVADRGREFVRREFSPAVVTERWRAAVDCCLSTTRLGAVTASRSANND